MSLYLSHPASLAHDTGPHPENAKRIVAIEAELERLGWPGAKRLAAPPAAREALLRAHGAAHVDSIERFCAAGGGMIDMDTLAVEASWEAALRAAGGACDAVERMLAGEAGQAFCGMRPPGHHAERDRAMGFCLLNNVAVAAAHAIALGAERVLVLDWDVHHGNGTEEIFAPSAEVLYSSIHQSPLYPGTGPASYEGTGAGEGYTVNLPVPPGSGPDEFLALVQHVVAPIAREYRPGLLAVSAGYDAHRADPLASCMLDEAAYADMTASMRALGEELGVPLLIVLEGGYQRDALAASVGATVAALSDGRIAREADPEAAAPHRARLAERWSSLGR